MANPGVKVYKLSCLAELVERPGGSGASLDHNRKWALKFSKRKCIGEVMKQYLLHKGISIKFVLHTYYCKETRTKTF